jgi:uncharacterized phage-like protein YoqJ
MGKTCCFFGHRNIFCTNELLPLVIEKAEQLILSGFDSFLFGGYGDFDNLCFHAIQTLKPKHPQIKTVFVQAYYNPHESDMEYFKSKHDEVTFPEIDTPARFAISRRNQIMIDMSDYCIFYVGCSFGGAYQALQYARRKKKPFLNLA